jgi:hypothetical protein
MAFSSSPSGRPRSIDARELIPAIQILFAYLELLYIPLVPYGALHPQLGMARRQKCVLLGWNRAERFDVGRVGEACMRMGLDEARHQRRAAAVDHDCFAGCRRSLAADALDARFRLLCLVIGVSLNKPTPIDPRIVGCREDKV